MIKINSDQYLEIDLATVLPTGNVNNIVPNSKNDLRNWIKLGDRIFANGTWPNTGYDDYFVINQATGRKAVARCCLFYLTRLYVLFIQFDISFFTLALSILKME